MKVLKLIFILSIALVNSTIYAQNTSVKEKNSTISTKKNNTSRYFYFPNLQAYFDTSKMVYYYKVNNEWETAAELPVNYGGYSLYNKAKVLIKDFDGENPQQFLNIHKKLYPYNAKGRFADSTAATN